MNPVCEYTPELEKERYAHILNDIGKHHVIVQPVKPKPVITYISKNEPRLPGKKKTRKFRYNIMSNFK